MKEIIEVFDSHIIEQIKVDMRPDKYWPLDELIENGEYEFVSKAGKTFKYDEDDNYEKWLPNIKYGFATLKPIEVNPIIYHNKNDKQYYYLPLELRLSPAYKYFQQKISRKLYEHIRKKYVIPQKNFILYELSNQYKNFREKYLKLKKDNREIIKQQQLKKEVNNGQTK